MDDVSAFLNSGTLELYVLGQATPAEEAEVMRMATLYPEVQAELAAIEAALESYGRAHAMDPDPATGPFIMATIDYMERLKGGEIPGFPPMLHAGSAIADFAEWLGREDLTSYDPEEPMQARIIGYTPQMTTVIAWLKYGSPPETHTSELEQFLIVEGSCDIVIEGEVHTMKPGSVITIPLYKSHHIKVTSSIPCKVILQRVAA